MATKPIQPSATIPMRAVIIQAALEAVENNPTKEAACQALGITRPALLRYLNKGLAEAKTAVDRKRWQGALKKNGRWAKAE